MTIHRLFLLNHSIFISLSFWLQQETKITICICDHQARDLLACVDVAMILSNGKVVAQNTPANLVKDINAKNAYFGESFKFN